MTEEEELQQFFIEQADFRDIPGYEGLYQMNGSRQVKT